jgi:excisionase family DNA binding protein
MSRVSLAQPLLTADQAGHLLGGIPAKTVLAYAREGRLPCRKIGKHVRFVRTELEDILSRSRQL